MRFHRLPVKDPRTVARDIPGICDLLFPQLLPAIITYLNRHAKSVKNCESIPDSHVRKASINAAMLFEVAYVRTEQILMGNSDENWDLYLKAALNRQERYFDAELPESFTEHDLGVARAASNNLVFALDKFKEWSGFSVELSPTIPGYQWIAEGQGDFSLGATLIEVKCTSKNFGSADYRQLLIYWLLSFAAAIEGKSKEWKSFILLNPRSNKYIELEFDELISFSAAGRSKIEILELFNSIVSDQSNKVNI